LEKARKERIAAQQTNFVEVVSNASISQENEQRQVSRLDAWRSEGKRDDEEKGEGTATIA
jgi:hypothetical protein